MASEKLKPFSKDWAGQPPLQDRAGDVAAQRVFVGSDEQARKLLKSFIQSQSPSAGSFKFGKLVLRKEKEGGSVKLKLGHEVTLRPASERERDLQSEVFQWFSPGNLGSVYPPFAAAPPFVCYPDAQTYEAVANGSSGGFIRDSNLIVIRASTGLHTDDAVFLAHEYFHLASDLGNRGIWTLGSNQFGLVNWLNEGLTELLAVQLAQANGMRPRRAGYQDELLVSLILQSICGEKDLRTAYLTGNFTYVRKKVDLALGKGTFQHLLECRNGAEAMLYLLGKAEAANNKIKARNSAEGTRTPPAADLAGIQRVWASVTGAFLEGSGWTGLGYTVKGGWLVHGGAQLSEREESNSLMHPPDSVRLAFLLRALTGQAIWDEAVRSQDFSKVASIVNSRLGKKDAFQQLLLAGNAPSALILLCGFIQSADPALFKKLDSDWTSMTSSRLLVPR